MATSEIETSRQMRANALGGSRGRTAVAFYGCTVWLTGAESSAKAEIAKALEQFLCRLGFSAYNLEAEVLNDGINANADEAESLRRAAESAKIIADSGVICITAYPASGDRSVVRKIHQEAGLRLFEIAVQMEDERAMSDDDLLKLKSCCQAIVEVLIERQVLPPILASRVPELFVAADQLEAARDEAKTLPSLVINDVDLQWLQVLAEGWAAPLRGFMTEKQFLQCLHFGTITDDKWGVTSNFSMPIVLSLSTEDKNRLADATAITLRYTAPNTTLSRAVAIIRNPEFYEHRNEERCSRIFGTNHPNHPGVKLILDRGEWLVGGEVEVLEERIVWNDGLDQYRLKPNELRQKFRELGADAVVAFQLRNPLHNGHALMLAETHKKLRERGFKKPFLLLHPLGGWIKADDVPLRVRIKQHKVMLESNLEGLKPDETLLAIFPSPQLYAGPREVQWHCRARMMAGVDFYIVGKDPAGVSHPTEKNKAMYEPSHGAKVLSMAQGLQTIEILPFRNAVYDRHEHCMVLHDGEKQGNFDFIGGMKLRALIRSGTEPPFGFMPQDAWRVLVENY